MPFGVFVDNDGVVRGSFPPHDVVKTIEKNKDAIEENSKLNAPYQVRVESILHDVLFVENVSNLKQLAKDAGTKIDGGKMEIVKAIAEKLCDCSDAPSDPEQGLKDALEKIATLSWSDRVVLSIWVAGLVREDAETMFHASDIVYEKASQDLKDFLIWYAPFHSSIDHRQLVRGMDRDTHIKNKVHFFIGKEGDKAYPTKTCEVVVETQDDKATILFEIGKSAHASDLYKFFYDEFDIPEGAFIFKWGTSEGASRLEPHDGLFAYIAGNHQVFKLHTLLKGGGVHAKLKKNVKLEQQKQDFAKKSHKAVGGGMAPDLLQKAEQVCARLVADNSGNYMKQLLQQKSVAELTAIKEMFKSKTAGKALRQMTGNFLGIHSELVDAKGKIDLALDALESVFEFQLIQCFYSDETQRFHYPSLAMIDAIIEMKSATVPPADQQMAG